MIRKEGSVLASAIRFRLLLFLDLLAMFRQKVVLHQLFYVVVLGVEDLLFMRECAWRWVLGQNLLLSLGSGSFLSFSEPMQFCSFPKCSFVFSLYLEPNVGISIQFCRIT